MTTFRHLSLVPILPDTPVELAFPPMPECGDQWQDRALCAQTDPEAFFPEKGGSTREAKKICLGCEVCGECLEYALAHDERFGIWGGLSERERRRLKRETLG
jgi:WhiB family transcriptional regulator, redox-sensing transcriptional regulator